VPPGFKAIVYKWTAWSIRPTDLGYDPSEKMIECVKSVTPSPPPEAEGEITIEPEDVTGAQGPKKIGSPVVDASKLLSQIDRVLEEVKPDVPPWVSDHSDASENSSDMDVEQLVEETLTENVKDIVDRTNDLELD
jgi:hypothetical protein